MYELANVDSDTTEKMISDAASEGFSVIRFWAFEPMRKNKLEEILNLAHKYGLYLIPVLADKWGYLQEYKINSDWYRKGFKYKYFNFIKDIVLSFRCRSEILLWEIINEPVTDSFPDIINFVKTTSEYVKSLDSNHLISIGTVGGIGDKFGNEFSRFSKDNFEKLYSLDSLDAISLHDYSFDSTLFERLDLNSRLNGKFYSADIYGSIDRLINHIPRKLDEYTIKHFERTIDFPLTVRSLWNYYNKINFASAKKLGKPVYIGEFGIKKYYGEKRKKILEMKMKQYKNAGASGVLLWSFESQGKSLDGHDYGFSPGDGLGDAASEYFLSQ